MSLPFKDIFHYLEDSCFLDSNSEFNLFARHYIYLPRINASLQQFVAQWNFHGIRTAGYQSPVALWHAATSCKIVETLSLKNTFSSFQYSLYLEFKPFPLPLPSPPFNVDCLSFQHFFVLLVTLIRGGGGLQCER